MSKKYKVAVEVIAGRKWVYRAALATRHRKPKAGAVMPDRMFQSMLFGLHSPIEEWRIWCDLEWIAERVHTHIVRHKETGKYVATSRPDMGVEQLKNKLCEELGVEKQQVKYRSMSWTINAKRLLEIAKQRLCARTWCETMIAVEMIKEELMKIEHVVAELMVPSCVWYGACPEGRECCGYDKTRYFDVERDVFLNKMKALQKTNSDNRQKCVQMINTRKIRDNEGKVINKERLKHEQNRRGK